MKRIFAVVAVVYILITVVIFGAVLEFDDLDLNDIDL